MPAGLLAMLAGGDRRSLGRTDEVVAMASKNPRLFPELIAGLWSEDPVVAMRSADAVEKITRARPALLAKYKREMLSLAAEATQIELRWHLALMVPRLPLDARERQHALSLLIAYLKDRSSIVKTLALQGLSDLAQTDSAMKPKVIEILEMSARTGTPAMRARSKKLLVAFDGDALIDCIRDSST